MGLHLRYLVGGAGKALAGKYFGLFSDSKSGDLIIKIVSLLGKDNEVCINFSSDFNPTQYQSEASMLLLSENGDPNRANMWSQNETKTITAPHTLAALKRLSVNAFLLSPSTTTISFPI